MGEANGDTGAVGEAGLASIKSIMTVKKHRTRVERGNEVFCICSIRSN